MKRLIKRIAAWVVFIFTCRGSIAAEAERAGICDFSGQGKEIFAKRVCRRRRDRRNKAMRSVAWRRRDRSNNPSVAFGDSSICTKEPTKGEKL